MVKRHTTYTARFSYNTIDRLSHKLKDLLLLSKSHKHADGNQVCMQHLQEIQDIINNMIEDMRLSRSMKKSRRIK